MHIHHRALFNGVRGQLRLGAMQQPEPARPPAALGIDVGACFQEHIQHLPTAHPGNERRIERRDGLIDFRFVLRMTFEQLAEPGRVVLGKRPLEQLERVAGFQSDGIHLFFQFRPTGEAVLAGNHQLGVAQDEAPEATDGFRVVGRLRMMFLEALEGFGIPGLAMFEEFFGLILELLQIRPRRERL